MWRDIPPTSVEAQIPRLSVTKRQASHAQKHRKSSPPAHVAADTTMNGSVCYLQSLNKITAFYEDVASFTKVSTKPSSHGRQTYLLSATSRSTHYTTLFSEGD